MTDLIPNQTYEIAIEFQKEDDIVKTTKEFTFTSLPSHELPISVVSNRLG